jgi:hypothetical protein
VTSSFTGGGPPPEEPSFLSQKIADIIGEDDPTVHGIDGGIDTSQPPTKNSYLQESNETGTASIR